MGSLELYALNGFAYIILLVYSVDAVSRVVCIEHQQQQKYPTKLTKIPTTSASIPNVALQRIEQCIQHMSQAICV